MPKTKKETKKTGKLDLYKAGVVCDLSIHWYKGMIKLSYEDLGFDQFPETELISLGRKKLIQKKHIKAIYSIDMKTRAFLRKSGFAFPIGNTAFIPYKRLEAVVSTMQDIRGSFNKEAEAFISNYGIVRGEMIDEYRKIFTQILQEHHKLEGEKLEQEVERLLSRLVDRFPSESELRKKFMFEFLVFEIGSPDFGILDEGVAIDKSRLNRQLEEEYQQKVRTKVDGFLEDVVYELKQMVLDITGNMINQLDHGTMNKNTIKGFKNFAETFKQLDFVDVAIDAQLLDLQHKLDGVSKEDLKNEEFKAKLRENIDTVTTLARNINVDKVLGKFYRKITIGGNEDEQIETSVNKDKRMIQMEAQG